MKYALVFLCGFAIDFFYVLWMSAVQTNQPLVASLASTAIGGCGLLGFTSVVVDRWMAVPYLCGLALGTAGAMSL
jgi:hypothetical protein